MPRPAPCRPLGSVEGSTDSLNPANGSEKDGWLVVYGTMVGSANGAVLNWSISSEKPKSKDWMRFEANECF